MSDANNTTSTDIAVADVEADRAAQTDRATALVKSLGSSYFDIRYADGSTQSSIVASLLELTSLLRSGNEFEREEAAAGISSLAKVDPQVQSDLAAAGAVENVVALMRDGETDGQTEWAIQALRALGDGSMANTITAVNEGAIPQLLHLLQVGTKDQQIAAVWTLLSFAQEPDAETIHAVVVKADGIDVLVESLRVGSPSVQERAARLLAVLGCALDEYGTMIVAAGALSPLVELLTNGTEGPKEMAAMVVAYLATDADKDAAMAAGVLEPLVVMLREGTSDEKYWAACAMGHLSANDAGDKRAVLVDVFATRTLIAFMREDRNKYLMAGVLGNLAYCCSANQDTLVEAGVLGPLVHLLRTGNANETRMAAMALGNLACRLQKNQEIVQGAGVVPLLVAMLRDGDEEQKRIAADALGDIVCDNSSMQLIVAHASVIDLLVELAKIGSTKQQIKAVRGLGKLAKNNPLVQSRVGKTGVIDVLVDFVSAEEEELQTMATRVLGKLVENHTGNQALVVKARAIGVLVINWRNSPSGKLKHTTARMLRYLAENRDASRAMEALGGQELLTPAATVNTDHTRVVPIRVDRV